MICWPLDRTEYTAEALGSWLATRTRGVFSANNNLDVVANDNLTVTVKAGLAWLKADEFWGCSALLKNDRVLEINVGDGVLNRIDAVVIRLDKVNNKAEVIVKQGVYASQPVIPSINRDVSYDEIYLATIYVKAGTVSITQELITDTRLNEELCGLMRDGVTQIPTAMLQLQVEQLIEHLRIELNSVEDGSAFMLKSLYDSTNSGVVDDSEKLGGKLPTYYATAEDLRNAQNTANAAMPKTGGTFTGKAYTHLAIEEAAQIANKAYVDGQTSSLNGKKTEIQRVWANASPSSPFPAQTFPNIVAGATMVIIRFWCTTSCTVTTTCFLLTGQTVACAVNGALNTWRQVQVGDGHIFFGGGYGYVTYGNATPSASDIYAIPLDIYAVKYTY